ncbi:MAG TPA: helix-turn-helix domain-containing protein [Coriobacteriia bacterium]|jgi:excisionase family DNA binding protein
MHIIAEGKNAAAVPVEDGLTTQDVADLLCVSRPHVVKLLEAGEIPFYRVGSHRRIEVADLLEYKRRRDAARRQTLAQLTRESQDLGLEDWVAPACPARCMRALPGDTIRQAIG